MTPVTIGMQVCSQHHIHSVSVKPRHKDISFIIEPFRVGTGSVAIGVQDNIPVHQHNFPLLFRLLHITPEPFFLRRQHVGLELIHFPHDAVQHNEVYVAVIEGIKLVLIFFRRAFRQLEVVQIGQRHPLFPFQVIGADRPAASALSISGYRFRGYPKPAQPESV